MMRNKQNDLDFIDLNNSHSQETPVLANLIVVIRRHMKLFILFIGICVLVGVMYIKSTPKNYQREAIVMVKDEKRGRVAEENVLFDDLFSFTGNSVDNEVAFFKSKRLMQKVAEILNLDISYKERYGLRKSELYTSSPFIVSFIDADPQQSISFTGTLLDEHKVAITDMVSDGIEYSKRIEVRIGETASTPIGKLVIRTTPFMYSNYFGQPIYVRKAKLKTIADVYSNKLNVDIRQQTSILRLRIIDESTKRAEDVLNTLIKVYEKDVIDDKNRVVLNTSNFIRTRLAIIEAELGIVDTEIEDFLKRNKLTNITSESALFIESSGRLDMEGLSVENQLNMAEYIRNYLVENEALDELIPAGIGINDNGIQSQIQEYNTMATKRNRLIANSSTNNPIVQELNNTLTSTRLSILNAVNNMITGLKIQVANMKRKESENINKIAGVPTHQKYVISIERQQKIKEELYLYLLNKKEEIDLQLSMSTSNCRIVDPASGSTAPVSPDKRQILLFAFVLGCVIPALYLYLRSLLNTNVHTKKEIKDALNIPFLGEIPLAKRKQTKGILIKKGSCEHICETFKILRNNFDSIYTKEKNESKVIQITSLYSYSGKTFITTNLAASIALSTAKVVVLDLDLRKGSLTKKSGADTGQKGLSCYLSGKENNIKDLIQSYADDRFDFIASGVLPPNPVELLKSERLDHLIAELKTQYDYILLDNPPYGVVVDASLCNRLADLTLFIIRSGLFDKRLLPEIQEIYDTRKMRNLSIVLNAVDFKKTNNNYGYGYGYGYVEEKKSLYRKCINLFH